MLPTSHLLLFLLPTGWNEDLVGVVVSYPLDHVDGATHCDSKTGNTCVPNTMELPYQSTLLIYRLLWEEEISIFSMLLWLSYVFVTVTKPNPN